MLESILMFVFLGTTIVGSAFLIRERWSNLTGRRQVAEEGQRIADALAQVAFGALDAKIPEGHHISKSVLQITDLIRNQFAMMTAEPLFRLCYVGTDGWLEGTKCADIVGQKLRGKGRVAVVVTSNAKVLIMAQRYRGFLTALAENFPGIKVEATFEAQTENPKAAAFVQEIASQVDAIYVTGNSVVLGASEGLAASGRAGQVYLLCHDIDSNIAPQIKRGVVSGSLVCSTIAQGRDPVLHIFNHIVAGWKPAQPRLITPFELVDIATMDRYWDLDKDQLIVTASLHQTGVTPRKAAPNRIRILVLQEDWNKAFVQMNSGVDIAQQELQKYNAEVTKYIINQTRRPKAEVLAEIRSLIEKESIKGLHGIVSYVGLADLVPVLNEQIAKKIPVTTYNSEPFSLRSVVLWLIQSSVELDRFSSDYQHGHHEINDALQEILNTIHSMVGRLAEESESARSGAKAVKGLLKSIETASEKEDQQVQTVEASTAITAQLSGMTDFFTERVTGLNAMKEQVQIFGNKIESITEYSEKIRSIIGIIENVSDQTNLLAFNAAIEASRAGEAGRGFKVIAEEIRKLADKTAGSTKDVSALISAMREAMSDTTQANTRTRTIVDEQVQAITDASSRLDSLSDQLVKTMEAVQVAAHDNSRLIREMRQTALELQQVVEGTSQVSNENSQAIETLSSTFAEISAQFSEMNRQTQQLGQLIVILRGTVSQLNAT